MRVQVDEIKKNKESHCNRFGWKKKKPTDLNEVKWVNGKDYHCAQDMPCGLCTNMRSASWRSPRMRPTEAAQVKTSGGWQTHYQLSRPKKRTQSNDSCASR